MTDTKQKLVKSINSKKFRKAKKISRKEFAKMLGVTETTIYFWDIGRCLPNADQLYRMSTILGVSMEELFVWS